MGVVPRFMTTEDILKALYEMKSIRLVFGTEMEREACRVRLYKLKKIQDKILSDILDEDKLVLRFTNEDEIETGEGAPTIMQRAAKIWLEKKKFQEFNVVEITDQEDAKTTDVPSGVE